MVLENVAKLMFFISLANNHATFFIIFFQRFKELHQVRNISKLDKSFDHSIIIRMKNASKAAI